MDTRNLTIGILSTTATILFVGLLLVSTQPPAVYASGLTTSTGPYTITVGSASTNDEELLYVIHGAKERMIIYGFDAGRKSIEIMDSIDLKEMRSATAGTTPPTQPGRRKP